jgi:hypothetical protein
MPCACESNGHKDGVSHACQELVTQDFSRLSDNKGMAADSSKEPRNVLQSMGLHVGLRRRSTTSSVMREQRYILTVMPFNTELSSAFSQE